VALEPPSSDPSSHDLVSAARTTDSVAALRGGADALVERLSPWGFWTGRGAVSYATVGSFVEYLLRTYGPERLKRAYAWANFEAVYGRSLRELAREWTRHVHGRPLVARAAREVVVRRFTRPSLFETTCPHYVPPPRRHVRAARRARQRGDTTEARTHLRRALQEAPQYRAAHAALARLRLAQGQAGAVRRQLDTLSGVARSASLLRLRGDARALTGAPRAARADYATAITRTPRYASARRVRLMLRDAVATRPSVVRVLVSGDSAHVQARRLAQEREGDAVAAWRALRLGEAHRHAAAADQWDRVATPLRNGRPPAWRQTWAVQRRAWWAEAAARAGRDQEARRVARAGSRRARSLGARAWARSIRQWGVRAAGRRSQMQAGRRVRLPAPLHGRTPGGPSGSRSSCTAGLPSVSNASVP